MASTAAGAAARAGRKRRASSSDDNDHDDRKNTKTVDVVAIDDLSSESSNCEGGTWSSESAAEEAEAEPGPSFHRRPSKGEAAERLPLSTTSERRPTRRVIKRLLSSAAYDKVADQCTQQLARLQRRIEQPSGAQDAGRVLPATASSETAFLLISRSIARQRMGILGESLKDAKAAIRTQSDNPRTYVRAAFALSAAGHGRNAVACLATARKLLLQANVSPNSSPALTATHGRRRRHSKLAETIDRLEASIVPRPLANLPLELMLRVLSFLDVKELLRTLTVSRRWRTVVLAHPPLWRHLDLTELVSVRQMRQELQSDGRRTRKALKRFCDLSRNSLVSLRLSVVGSAEGVEAILAMVRSNAATLEELRLDRCVALEVFTTVLPLCRSLRSLEIQHPSISRYSYQEADYHDSSMARVGISAACAEQLDRIRLRTLGIHREALSLYPQCASMLSELRILRICSPAKSCSPFAHVQLHDAFAFDALALAHETIEEVRLSSCQQVPLRYEMPPLRLEEARLVFGRLQVLEGWLPRVSRGRSQARRESGLLCSFPALREVDVGFECDDDEEAFYRRSLAIVRLSHRADLYPTGTQEPSGQIEMLSELEELSIVYRPQVGAGAGRARLWSSLVPRFDVDRMAEVACPKLCAIRIEYADRELSGSLLIRLVLLRLYLSKGMSLEEALIKSSPERNGSRSVSGMAATGGGSRSSSAMAAASPFSRGGKTTATVAVAVPPGTRGALGQGQVSGEELPCCRAIGSLHLRGCEGVDEEAAAFLRKVVTEFSYSI